MGHTKHAGRAPCRDIAVAVASNNSDILAANLQLSPMIAEGGVSLHVETGAPSAGIAYNQALDATDAEYVVFAHQDVYLPRGWDALLQARITQLASHDPNWAIIGCYGIGLDGAGYGPIWSTSLGAIAGRIRTEPVVVQSIDEAIFIVRRSAGLRFDDKLPGFHFYGTDIVQTAKARGRSAYVVPVPCIHNDQYKDNLGDDFAQAYHYIRSKWRAALPLRTPILKVSWHGLDLMRIRGHLRRSREIRKDFALTTTVDARVYAEFCSWNDLSIGLQGQASPL